MIEKKTGTRQACFNLLKRMQKKKAYSNILMSNLKEKYGFNQVERRFFKSLVLGVLERQLLLDYVLSFFISKKPDMDTQILLRMGLQQQLFMEVPPSAACNETVKVAKTELDKSRAGFINAVLRNIGRSTEKVNAAIEGAPPNIKHSISDSIYELLYEQYREKTDRILSSFLVRKQLFLRVNTLRTATAELVQGLERHGVEAEFLSEATVSVGKGSSYVLERLSRGEYYVQGLGSQKAVAMLEAQEGQTVIDVCACPGGKSFGAAIDMRNKGRVISLDIHESKLGLVERYAELLGIKIITVRHFDSRQVIEELTGIADRVICDVPCSGLGVIAAKPEIRYKSAERFAELIDTQKRILSSSSKYLNKGGVLIYSTCTINRNENEAVVADFIEKNSDFCLEYERTFFPYEEVGEGFYIAKIIRNQA